MKFVALLLLSALAVACSEEKSQEVKKEQPEKIIEVQPVIDSDENLVEIVDNVYTEYYPGKKAVKIQGQQNDKGERDGKWSYFSEEGTELSMTYFENGKKQGHSIVKHPNGAVNYMGEYKDDKPIGVWETYSPEGKLINKKDYGKASK